MLGLPALRQAVAEHYGRRQGLNLTPEQVIVTAGATEALTACFLALLSPGDEVVLFQPLYDSYAPMVRRAGGVPRLVRLEPPTWALTRDALEAAFTVKTRLVVFNNPLNPAAIVYPRAQLELLADICRRFDCLAVCDEVWEHVVFDGVAHIPLISLPGMVERTIKIGSAGKIFALTGWKIGWTIASPELTAILARAHQYLTFSVAANLQSAIAQGLERTDDYFEQAPAAFARSRDRLSDGLRTEGFSVLPSHGTYFLNVDLAASGVRIDAAAFCLQAVASAKVAAIPVSAFYEEQPVTHIMRLCFAKADATLDLGVERLSRARDVVLAGGI